MIDEARAAMGDFLHCEADESFSAQT